MSHYPYYPTHPYQAAAYPPGAWNAAATQPTSAPPSSGAGNPIQFGSLHPTQVEALQYGYQPMYGYPYPMHMAVAQYPAYAAHPQMGPPQHGSQPPPGGMPPGRDTRVASQYDGRSRGGRVGQHGQRERGSSHQRDGGDREGPPHHKNVRGASHGHPHPPSRSETPTSQQQPPPPQPQQQQQQQPPQQQQQQPPHREGGTAHHPQTASSGYPSQNTQTSSMAMHHPPHSHHPHYPYAAHMQYYYPAAPHYPAPGAHAMQPQSSEMSVPESGQGYSHKSGSRMHLEPMQPAWQHPPEHSMPIPSNAPESMQKQAPTPTGGKKQRLLLIDPHSHTPIADCEDSPDAHHTERSTSSHKEGDLHSSNKPSSKPASPRTEIEKTVSEVISISGGRTERSSNKVMVKNVSKADVKSGEPPVTTKRTPMRSTPQGTEPKILIDPSKGTHRPGLLKQSGVKAAAAAPDAPIVITKGKDTTSSTVPGILKTVQSVERVIERDQQQQQTVEKVADEGRRAPASGPPAAQAEEKATPEAKKSSFLILSTAERKAAKTQEVVAGVVAGTQVMAPSRKVAEPEPPTAPPAKTEPAAPVTEVAAETPQSPVPLPEEEEKEEPVAKEPEVVEEEESAEPQSEAPEEEKMELAAIETKREAASSDTKTRTPSKNVYSPRVMQEFRERNKEPLPDMGSGPWIDGSDVDSPSKDRLPRRNSSGKLGSRSNSNQGLSRRNSNSSSSRAHRHSKSDVEDVFHVSSKKRIYTTEYLLSVKRQFTDKPPFDEVLQCMKEFEGAGMRRSGSDRWSKPGGRSAYDSKPTLSRTGSGRDWPKETSRTGGVVVTRRISRAFSGQGQQRGADDSKWGKADVNMLSPFAPNHSGVGLHHADNRYVVGEMQTDDPEEEKRQKTFKGVLNKLTPSNFAKMYEKFKEVEIVDPKTLKGLIDQIFDKALTETTFCPLYSDLCKLLTREMPEFEEEGDKRKLTFRRLLLNKCQNEFEKGDAAVRAAEEAEAADDSTMSAEERQSRLMAAKKERLRSLGNMQFIGFLFKKGMLTERIIHNCIVDLLSEEENPKPEDIECLCQLLTTVGALLTSQKEVIDAYFSRIERLAKHQKLETRYRFMLLDLIELKERRWVERREKEGPKKIEEIHRDAQIEQMAQNSRNRGGGGYGGSYGSRNARSNAWSRTPVTATRPMPSFTSHEEVKPLTKNLSLGRTSSSDISLRPSNIGAPKASPVVTMPRPRSRSPTSPPPPQQSPIEEVAAEEKPSQLDGESLMRQVKSLLTEYYSVNDLEEALRCIEDLISQNAHKPEILKSVLLSALDIRGVDVDDRLKPISPILKELLNRKIFAPQDTKKGLQSTMTALPEVADEFPKAPCLIARMLGSLVSEGIIPLRPILDTNGIILGAGRETLSSEEDDTPLVDSGLASEILIEILKQMKGEEQEEKWVRDALHKEDADLSLFYPSYLRDDTDLSEELQFLD